jgi:TRAP-type mannitol/chloroaromatic compound transport system substrate-binding protein
MQQNGMLIAYATAEGELASDVGDGAGPYARESVCRQNLRRSLAMIPDLERQALAELRNRGVTVLPYLQAVLTNVRQAGQKILDVVAREDVNFARVLASYNKYR